ncbi:MAPEG family protein [Wenzhouxiangella sp. XN79A]|uniref:MAPEG family protein n=1 Tax=Wenzhouxiangella sp. XN79A TaxID=2724193 RepID=UPI00144AAF0D|nr:MAPEG family protein [Wenzhouxiangella sp. XN79A]NKI35632.1 MAPEG family protein [Wenzhouxiangella sp. XN79A]
MQIAIACLLFSALMVVLTKVPLAMQMAKDERGYDNRNPRRQQAGLTGFGARALAAHQNMIEAFPIFAAGVLVALISGATGTWLPGLALTFVGARIVYSICYWADLPTLRSAFWVIGYGASLGLMGMALF